MRGVKVVTGAAAAVLLMAYVGPTPALADTIEAALVRAYQNNPQLNAQRALVRVHRRKRAAGAVGLSPARRGHRQRRLSIYRHQLAPRAARRPRSSGPKSTAPTRRAASALTVTQTLFNGQQTANKTRAAESQVSGAREALRVLEQTVLLSAATIYMDYLRDSAIVEVQRSNTRVLEQTLKQTRDRFNVGEVTRTDVAQSEAQLAAGKTQQLDRRSQPDHDASRISAASSATSRKRLRRARRWIASCRERCPARSISA